MRLETVIAAPIGDCFELSLSVDAHTASMRVSGERAVGGVTSGIMKLGDTVTWRARHVGIVFRMTSGSPSTSTRAGSSMSSCAGRSGGGGTSTRSRRLRTARR
jgi:hypothetical protein